MTGTPLKSGDRHHRPGRWQDASRKAAAGLFDGIERGGKAPGRRK